MDRVDGSGIPDLAANALGADASNSWVIAIGDTAAEFRPATGMWQLMRVPGAGIVEVARIADTALAVLHVTALDARLVGPVLDDLL